jgi:hypothetical protein
VDPRPKGRIVLELVQPFERSGLAAVAHKWVPFTQLDDGDSEDNLERSPLLLFEDKKPLGPPHSPLSDIGALGHGRFSHWHQGFVFSASDDSDPNSNGRRYWAVVP